MSLTIQVLLHLDYVCPMRKFRTDWEIQGRGSQGQLDQLCFSKISGLFL